MAEIAPFRGILYQPRPGGDVSRFLSPPYDVISESERAELAASDPHNSVRLILPKDPVGGDTDARYPAAAQLLAEWLHDGTLRRDDRPAIYRYHQTFTPPGDRAASPVTRRGFICRIRLHRFEEQIVLPHERTLAGPKADRLKLKRATRAHLSQVFGLFADPTCSIDAAFATLDASPPDLHGSTGDGVEHCLFRLVDPVAQDQVMTVLRDKRIYIADGHHRYETMLALRDELQKEPGYLGPASSVDYGTIFLCKASDPGLLVFPTHRVIHGLPGFDFADVLHRAAAFFTIEERPTPTAAETRDTLAKKGRTAPTFLLAAQGRAAYLSLRPDADLSAVPSLKGPCVLQKLDVTLLHALLLEGILGIDRAAQEAQTHLRYIKDTEKALAESRAPGVQAVWLMNPTPVEQVMAVADAGQVMPQKSTYFYPKLASGLVLNPLDPREPVDRVPSFQKWP